MHIIIYARVSTSEQAERELSLPAQRRLMERYAEEHGWIVDGYFQDVASGKSFKERPGLMAALKLLATTRSVGGLLVHKLDRLSRNTFNYLLLKGQLRRRDIRILSVVETIDDSPLGEFLEHIIAAQAEFYSANLSLEVKKGLEERLLRGQWAGSAPVGYLMVQGRLQPDPARAHLVRRGYELWATGSYTSEEVAEAIYHAGLVGRTGKRIRPTAWCRILQNQLYAGIMVVKGTEYQGGHQPIIPRDLFERAQEVFRQKRTPYLKRAKRIVLFLLSRKVRCSRCSGTLVGERHQKPSGRLYQYYRCHQKACRNMMRADILDQLVVEKLRAMRLQEKALPILRRRVRVARREAVEAAADRVRHLRRERGRLEDELRQLAKTYATGYVADESYDLSRSALRENLRATEWLLATPNLGEVERGDERLIAMLKRFEETIAGEDPVARRELFDALVERVELTSGGVVLILSSTVMELLAQDSPTGSSPAWAEAA